MGISDSMNELEKLRKTNNVLKVMTFILPAALVVITVFSNLNSYRTNDSNEYGYETATKAAKTATLIPFLFIVVVAIFLASSHFLKQNKQKFQTIYKETFVVSALSNYFSQVVYHWQSGFSQNQVANFGLSRLGNRYSSEDYLRGEYNGIRFEQSDVKIQYHSSNGKSSSTTTYFKGRMMAFDFPKNQVIGLQIYSKNFMYSDNRFRLQKVKMESDYFNKHFIVKTVNEHDAYYILTPALMERIQALKEKYRTLIMYFSAGRLCVGIEGCTDTFDPPMMRKLSYPEEKERVRRDVQDIIDVIEIMTQNPVMQ